MSKRQLRCVYHVYKNSKPVKGVEPLVIVKDLESPVSIPSVNKVLDVVQEEARVAIMKSHPDAYPVMYSYDPVETDTDKPCYCFVCKKGFTVKDVYGISFTTPRCPQGHTKTTDKNGGKCFKCKKGHLWETKVRRGGPECMVHHYKCDSCGATESEAID